MHKQLVKKNLDGEIFFKKCEKVIRQSSKELLFTQKDR